MGKRKSGIERIIKMKYVVPRSIMREEIRPFAGCFEVIKETNSFVWIINKHGEEEKIGKVNVCFFSNKDVSKEIKEANDLIQKSYNTHTDFVARVITNTKLAMESA
jgi:hypothetical protein